MIGQLLVATRTITQDQLDQALHEQRQSGALLGDVLVSKNYLTQESLAKALAQEARVPFTSLDGVSVDPGAASLVPESMARRGAFVPLARTTTRLRVAQSNPFDVTAIDDLQRAIDMPVEVVCAPGDAIARLLDKAYGPGSLSRLQPLVEEGVAALSQPYADVATEDSPVVRLIEVLIEDAVRVGASDLHLEPEEKLIRIRYRLDGVLAQIDTLPKELQPSIVSRLKVMAGLDIAEQRMPQEGRIT